jgi:hypothetical protein
MAVVGPIRKRLLLLLPRFQKLEKIQEWIVTVVESRAGGWAGASSLIFKLLD